MPTNSRLSRPPSTFLAIESLSRRAHFGRDVLHLPNVALLDDLRQHNARSPAPLPSSFVDELLLVVTQEAA